jgi:hypothetical protein
MSYAAEPRDFLFQSSAFAAQDKLMRRQNPVDGFANFITDARVLRS